MYIKYASCEAICQLGLMDKGYVCIVLMLILISVLIDLEGEEEYVISTI